MVIVLFAFAGGLLGFGLIAKMSQFIYDNQIRAFERNRLPDEEIESLRKVANGPLGPARGNARQRLVMYDKPGFVRKSQSFWRRTANSAFVLCVVLAVAGGAVALA